MHVFSFLVILLSTASAVTPQNTPYTEPVTQALLDKLQLYASYAAATYCASNNNSPGKQLTCYINETSTTSCTLVHDKSAITTLWEFENIEPGDVTGFLAVDSERREIVLAFRGSKSKSNWRTNKRFTLQDWKEICNECKVHRGFHEAYEAVKQRMVQELREARKTFPEFRLIVTGHSLGGAMATVTSVSLRGESGLQDLGKDIELYTYGAPRVGNPALIEEIEARGHKNFRVTKGSDPVPHVPIDLGTSWHFKQFFPQYHIQGDELTGVVKVENLKICMDSKPCRTTWNIHKWQPHAWYLLERGMSACAPAQDASDVKPKAGEKIEVHPAQPEIPLDIE